MPDATVTGEEVAELKPAAPVVLVRVGEEGQLHSNEQPDAVQVSLRSSVAELPSPTTPSADANRLSVDETDTLQLMHDLQADNASIRDAASRELISRGFAEAHLELARELTSNSVAVRAAVAGKLPGTPGIDARLWLTWMLRDESAEVRLAALSVLATTGQSDALRRAIEIARQDRDPRIRHLLDQLDKQRRGSR